MKFKLKWSKMSIHPKFEWPLKIGWACLQGFIFNKVCGLFSEFASFSVLALACLYLLLSSLIDYIMNNLNKNSAINIKNQENENLTSKLSKANEDKEKIENKLLEQLETLENKKDSIRKIIKSLNSVFREYQDKDDSYKLRALTKVIEVISESEDDFCENTKCTLDITVETSKKVIYPKIEQDASENSTSTFRSKNSDRTTSIRNIFSHQL